jgi:hypothetical protein
VAEETSALVATLNKGSNRESFLEDTLAPFALSGRRKQGTCGSLEDWKLKVTNSEGMKGTEILPVFWPQEVFNKWHEVPAHPDQLQRITFRSVERIGVWKDADGTNPVTGCIVFENWEEISMAKEQVLESSAQGSVYDRQLEISINSARKQSTISPTATVEAPTPAPKMKANFIKPVEVAPVKSTKRKLTEEAVEEDLFDFSTFLTGTLQSSISAPAAAAEASPKKKARKAGATTGKASPKRKAGKGGGRGKASPKKKGGKAGTGSASVKPTTPSKSFSSLPASRVSQYRQRKMEAVDREVLKAKVFCQRIEGENTCKQVQALQVASTATKLMEILDDDSEKGLRTLFMDGAGVVCSRGQRAISRVENYFKMMDLMASVCRAMESLTDTEKPEEAASATEVHSALHELEIFTFDDIIDDDHTETVAVRPDSSYAITGLQAFAKQLLGQGLHPSSVFGSSSRAPSLDDWASLLLVAPVGTADLPRRLSQLDIGLRDDVQKAIIWDAVDMICPLEKSEENQENTPGSKAEEKPLAATMAKYQLQFENMLKMATAALNYKADFSADIANDGTALVNMSTAVLGFIKNPSGISDEALRQSKQQCKTNSKLFRHFLSRPAGQVPRRNSVFLFDVCNMLPLVQVKY